MNLNKITITTDIINQISDKFLLYINFYKNNTIITKNSKEYKVFSRILHQNNIFQAIRYSQEFGRNSRNLFLKQQNESLNYLFFNRSNLRFFLSDFFLNIERNNFVNKIQYYFLTLSPKIITMFIKRQLFLSIKYQTKSFSRNLQTGIMQFTNNWLIIFQNLITGLKIECKGK